MGSNSLLSEVYKKLKNMGSVQLEAVWPLGNIFTPTAARHHLASELMCIKNEDDDDRE